MKRKFIFLMMMCLFGLSGLLNAQEDVVTINGDATSYSNIYPIAFNYNYQLSQHIYTAEEINHAAGTIEKIAFKVNVTQTRNLTFYLINTDKSDLSGWESFSDADKVFSQTISTAPTDEWLTIELENSFEYTGSNILLVAHDNTGSNVYTYAAGSAYLGNAGRNATYYTSGSSPVSTSSGGWTSARQPAVRFTFAAADDGLEPAVPANITATAIDHKSISLTWDAAENAKAYSIYQAGVKVATVTSTSYIVEGLGEQTEYCFTVTGVRGTKESAHSTEVCATTAKAPASLNVVFTLKDSYGDGWNGGTLTVTATDGTNQTFSFTNGAETVYTLNILQGADVTVTFNAGSYTDECTYCIAYEDGEEIHCSGAMNIYANRTYNFIVKSLTPSVEVNTESIAFGNVRLGEFWTEGELSFNVRVEAKGGAEIDEITSTDDFFRFTEAYPAENSVDFTVRYDKNGSAGVHNGNMVITYLADGETFTKEIPMSATAYTATEPDAIEVYRTIEFDGEYSDTPTFANLHDDYILPGEANEGSTPDAVYKFTLESEGLLTATVTGTNGIAAIYKAEDLEGSGPSSDNNYEGVVTAPSEPALPTTFFYDFNTNLDDFTLVDADGDGHHWKLVDGTLASYSWENGAILYPNNYIYTIQAYSITANSKLTYKVQAANYPDHYAVVASEDGINFNILFEEDYLSYTQISREVDLKDYAGKNLYLGFRHFNCSNQYAVYIDDFQLTDGSSKTRENAPQIDGVVYPAGTYYLVAAAEDEFTVSLSAETVPAPAAFAYTAPENEAMEQVNPKLTWEASEYATSYKVYLGTELPLTEYVEVETPSYQTENLQNNTKYYWSVTAVNNAGETAGEVWSFVTPLNQVTELAATATNLYPGETTAILWTEAEGATGYNVYVNDVKVNEELVTETSYELTELPHNINSGNAISVTAVHTLGESPKCEAVYVKMAGEFTLVVNVTDTEGNPLEGAAVSFNTESYYDEYNQAIDAVETLSTDANGQIKQVLPLPSVYDYYNNPVYAQMTVTVSKEYANDGYITINSYTYVTDGEDYEQDVTLYYVAPQNIQLDDYYNQYVIGDKMTMTWDVVDGATGYNVYRGEWNDETYQYEYTLLTTETLADTTFTVELTEYEYAPVYGVSYAVTAVYTVGESPKTEKNVYVTGENEISVLVKNTNDEVLKDAIVTLTGRDDFNNEKTYEFTTNAEGTIAENILVGTYTATVTRYDYNDAVVEGIALYYGEEFTTVVVTMESCPEAEITVTATEAADGTKVNVSWEAEYQKYNVFRRNVTTEEVVMLASDVTLNEYEATDWASLENGMYQYGVSAEMGGVISYTEGFEGGTLPEGWSKYKTGTSYYSHDWNISSVGYYSIYPAEGSYAAYMDNSNGNSTATMHYLVTPQIDLTGVENGVISFKYETRYYSSSYSGTSYTNTLRLLVSTSPTGPWTELWTNGAVYTTSWTDAQASLADYKDEKVYLAFETNIKWGRLTAVDNITFPPVSYSQESAVVWSEPIKKVIAEFTNAAEDNDWHNAANWSTSEVPTAETNVKIAAAAVISAQDAVAKNITIASGASVTVSAERILTAQNIYNTGYSHSQLIINDGAQVFQNREGVLATFNMGIVNPGDYGKEHDGWQFIAVPFTDASFSDFTGFMAASDVYDLYKYDGESDLEWNAHADGNFDAGFVNGRAYLASHKEKEAAAIYGTLNSAKTHTYSVTYNAEKDLANFHLLGNPFSFDMDWSNVVVNESVYNGFATIDPTTGGYIQATEGTIPVGDGFFVKVVDADPAISYAPASKSRGEKSEYINVFATGKQGSNNVIIKLDGAEDEGFAKLENINQNIADVYVKNNDKQFSILSYDRNVTEVELFFDAKEMGNYTINAVPSGKFNAVTLVDRMTGAETNLLLEDYNFTATTNDSPNRFILKFANGQEPTANFVYQSGEELIVNAEGTIQIIDVMGRIVYSNDVESTNNRINVSNLKGSAYVVRNISDNVVRTQKIVIL